MHGLHFCYVPFETSSCSFRDIVPGKQGAINLVAADVTFLTRPMPVCRDTSRPTPAGAFELKRRSCCAGRVGARAGAAADRGMDRSSTPFAFAFERVRAPRRFTPFTTRVAATMRPSKGYTAIAGATASQCLYSGKSRKSLPYRPSSPHSRPK